MATIRILLADDHALVRAGIHMLLDSQEDFEVVGEAEDGRKTVDMVRQLQPDVVVMDLVMPDMDGLEATQRIRAESPDVRILALTMHEDERCFFQAIHAGASGFIIKGAPPSDFIAAVRSVAQGQAYLSPSFTGKLIDDYLHRAEDPSRKGTYGELTDREREIVCLIAEGHTGRQIAERLGVSVHTVEWHRQNVMAKLDLHNRAGLIKYAIRRGLVELEG